MKYLSLVIGHKGVLKTEKGKQIIELITESKIPGQASELTRMLLERIEIYDEVINVF